LGFVWILVLGIWNFKRYLYSSKSNQTMRYLFLFLMAFTITSCNFTPPEKIWLHEMDLSAMETGWGTVRAKLSCDSNSLSVGGQVYELGVGTHAISKMMILLNGNAVRFTAEAGVDDESGEQASVEFFVLGDGQILWQSGLMKKGDKARRAEVDLKGIRKLALYVSDAGDYNYYDHADWLAASIEYRKDMPLAVIQPKPEPYILTPPVPEHPRINGPSVTGAGPGKPFLFKIPATGKKPVTFAVDKLPEGLHLDASSGIISGVAPDSGDYQVTIRVSNDLGEALKDFRIVTGKGLALTPPMGWNSWNCWGLHVDDPKVRAAADAFLSSGLADHGWTYINIDDGWEAPERSPKGEILTNEKFPDMNALSDYVHRQGLKIGIYSSPGPRTCGGYLGSYQNEEQDAKTWSAWGIDYLKYDWCSYGQVAPNDSLPELEKPFRLMREMLDKTERDIIYSLCQYGMGNVWEWGALVGGNLWRTTGDITDTWESMAGIGFSQDKCSPFAGPGYWNDPDMLVVGQVGWGPNLHPTRLTPDEQYTHISLWCLLASPLLIGCDLSQLDPFTLNLLTNDEVLAVNQDVLGIQARKVREGDGYQIWAKPLADSSLAVGIFYTGLDSPVDAFNWNGGVPKRAIAVRWSDLGISGLRTVRDLWRQKDIGNFSDMFTAEVPFHGAVLVQLRHHE
jgi:alpha-galactosidase